MNGVITSMMDDVYYVHVCSSNLVDMEGMIPY